MLLEHVRQMILPCDLRAGDQIIAVRGIPRTGRRPEIPVRRVLGGTDPN